MKKLINGALVLALVGTTLFTSCSKSDVSATSDNSSMLVYKQEVVGGTQTHKLVTKENGELSCPPEGHTCLCGDDDIVINPDNTVFMDVLSEIDKGDAHAISQIFEVNYDVLTRYVKPFFIQGVIDGKMTVSAHENKTNNLKFFFFKEVSSGEEMAYQLNFVK